MSRSLPLPYKPYESTFALIFLFLEPTLQQETHIYINSHNLGTLFLLFLSSLDNDFILIGHFKQCVQCRTTRGILKIERCGHMEAPTHGLLTAAMLVHRTIEKRYFKNLTLL